MSIIFSSNKEIKSIYRFTLLSILLSCGIILHYIDFNLPVGGFMLKVGLSNIIIVCSLFLFGWLDTVIISFLKITITSLLEPNFTGITLLISMGGALLSLIIMIISKYFMKNNIIMTSCLGGIFHNFGQLIVVLIITRVILLLYYTPLLFIFGIITGYVIGKISNFIFLYLNKFNKRK